MTEIINLFRNNQHSPHLHQQLFSQPNKHTLSSFNHIESPSRLKDNWNLGELQSSLRRGVKKELDAKLMKQQMQIYESSIRSLFWNKLLIMTLVSLALIMLMGLQGSTIFTLAVFLVIKLLAYQNFNFNNDLLVKKSIKCIYPLVYCSLSYSLMKWIISINNKEFNWLLTVISLLLTIVNALLQHYQPFFIINARQNIHRAILIKSSRKKIMKFMPFFFKQLQLIFTLKLAIIKVVAIFIILLLLSTISLKISPWTIFTEIPKYTLQIILVFLFLTFYQAMIDFLNLTYITELAIIINKMPIFLNLLRLESTCQYNLQIQNECTKSLYLKMMKTQSYLSTETCKSLIYTTYMDIFNQYATIRLQKLTVEIMAFITSLNACDQIINSRSSLIDDLFIHLRKVNAYVQAEISSIQLFEKVAEIELLFHIIMTAKSQALKNNETLSISFRIMDLLNNFKQKLKESIRKASLNDVTKIQIIRLFQSIQNQADKDEQQATL